MKKDGFLQPHFLAEQDIVIITYDVLRSELNYVDIPHSNSEDGRRLRNQKRYMAIPSPLVAVEWWRICLDEAQMVECPTVKVRISAKSFEHWGREKKKEIGEAVRRKFNNLSVIDPQY